MASIAPEWIGVEPVVTEALTVLVAEPEAAALITLSEELTGRGFSVIPVTSWSSAVTVLAAHNIHIVVAHGSLPDLATLVSYQTGASLSADRSSHGREIPFIFSVTDAEGFDWKNFALLDRADYVLAPVTAEDLAQRVDAVALRLRRRAMASARAERLRAAVRGVSVAIQSTREPADMAALLVTGVAEVFDVRQVYFSTFPDDRVALISLQTQTQAATPTSFDLGEHEPLVHGLATRLWQGGESSELGDHDSYQLPAGYPELVVWPRQSGDQTFLAVPLGDRISAFGLLWVADVENRRSWSPIEVSLLRHLAGVASQALMQGRIITGQQEVLKRLQRLDDAKTNFLRAVNHELRTPLTSLTAYLDLIRDGAGGELPPSALTMLAVVERNAQRLGLLVEDVLTVSRMTADPEVDWKPVNLTQLVSGVVEALSAAATTRGVQLAATTTASDLMVEGDPVRLRQVFWNIVDNAVKFTPATGQVQVSAESCGGADAEAVTVVVADSGGGITADDLPEVFTSFFRGSNAHAEAVPGSGLGLAIVRGVVDAHGGTIEVADTLGGGTTISVRLPAHRRPAA